MNILKSRREIRGGRRTPGVGFKTDCTDICRFSHLLVTTEKPCDYWLNAGSKSEDANLLSVGEAKSAKTNSG